MAEVLTVLSRTTGLQIFYVSDVASGRRSGGAPKGMAVRDALAHALAGTELHFEFLNERVVRIYAPPMVEPGSRDATRPTTPSRPVEELPSPIQDVVVTANRREEPARRVPISVTAWSSEELAAVGATDFASVALRTPGVEYDFYPDIGPGNHTNIAIRGIDARDGTSTAVFLDDVPLRPDPGGSVGRAMPLLADLERVEILRGPQSTLLGDAAEGGAIRFITVAPSLIEQTGFAQTRVASTERGGPSLQVAGAAGGPIVDRLLGFRVSGGYEADGGFVDRVDPFTGALVDVNSNRSVSRAARLALTWAPNDALELTPALTYQLRHTHDSSMFFEALSDPVHGILRSGKLLQQPTDDEFSLASLKATLDLDSVTLTSVTGHFHRSVRYIDDATNNGIGWGNPQGPEYPASDQTYLSILNVVRQSEWSEEVRLASTDPARRLGWLGGALLLHASFWDEDAAGPAVNGQGMQIGNYDAISRGRETQAAIFGDVKWSWTERLATSVGVRFTRSNYDATVPLNVTGPAYVTVSGRESPSAHHLTLSYQADPASLYYATVSTGYRLGGTNWPIQAWCAVQLPQSYGPDSVTNWELGTKLRLFDDRGRIEASAFHMLWKNLQTDLNAPVSNCFTYMTNVGTAASDGFEIASDAALTRALRIGLTVAYARARYTQTIYENGEIRARDGDSVGSIPVVPSPWNLSAYAQYEMRLQDSWLARFAVEDYFHSRNNGPFYSLEPNSPNYDPTRRPDPSNNLLNLRVSLRKGSGELSAFVDNVLDSQPTLSRRNYYPGSALFVATTFRPRTVGASVAWRY